MFTVAGGFPSAPSAIFLNSDLPRNDQFFSFGCFAIPREIQNGSQFVSETNLIEFKEILYSSPMTTRAKGKYQFAK